MTAPPAMPALESADPRARSAARRWGYRLLPGDGFSYLLHMRPREWPIVTAHAALGYFLAAGAGTSAVDGWGRLLLGLAVFVLCLNGGTLAINSAFDRDEGDVGYLDAPPPPPRHLFGFGLGLMALGQLVALLALPGLFSLIYAVCFGMSILYSVPPFRFKAVAGLDLAINALGFGALTPLAGWALTGRPVPAGALLLIVGFAPLFAALYPLTQLYQYEEDRARGDRTLALVLGMRRSLGFSILAMLIGFAIFFAGLAILGVGGVALALLLVPFLAWALVLSVWYARYERYTPRQHKRGMYLALQAWAITDVTLFLSVLLS